MPQRARIPCAHGGCQDQANDGRFCTLHKRARALVQTRTDRQLRGSSSERGYGVQHRRWRERVLQRDPLCVTCKALGLTTLATVADHVVPVRQGGNRFALENGQGLCHAHHNAKTRVDGSFTKRARA